MTAAQNQHCFGIKSVNYVRLCLFIKREWNLRVTEISLDSLTQPISKSDLLGTGDIHSTVKVDNNCGTQSWNNEA